MPELMDIVEAEDITLTTEQAITALEANRPKKGYAILNKATDMAIKALEENQQYRAIGAIKEVQELKENQRNCKDCAGCTSWKCDCANIREHAITEFAEHMKGICKGITFAELFIDEIAEKLRKEPREYDGE